MPPEKLTSTFVVNTRIVFNQWDHVRTDYSCEKWQFPTNSDLEWCLQLLLLIITIGLGHETLRFGLYSRQNHICDFSQRRALWTSTCSKWHSVVPFWFHNTSSVNVTLTTGTEMIPKVSWCDDGIKKLLFIYVQSEVWQRLGPWASGSSEAIKTKATS